MPYTFETFINGQQLTLETGKLAEQADGAVTVRYGDTVVLVTACASAQPREDVDFLPLTVDYEERLYAAGKIPGGYIKREGRPSTNAILVSRLTDRPIRPLFPKGFRNDTQVIVTVLSADQENDPDVLAIVGASAALGISNIPFAGPVSAVRVGHVNGELVVNPTFSQLVESDLELVVASTKDAIVMVEAGAKEVPEDLIIEALRVGHEANQEINKLQEGLIRAIGKPTIPFEPKVLDPAVEAAVASLFDERLAEALLVSEKTERIAELGRIKETLVEELGDKFSADALLSSADSRLRAIVRKNVLEKGIRPDGRDPKTIRNISSEVGVLPRTHGSGLFTRGQTQVLTICTLGSLGEEQRLDGLTPEETKRFMHHYNFPPFSVGEVKRLTGPGRREIGHGALAERALEPVVPSEEEFPYTIRLVSEVLSSNGSTSMASVCGSTLSLMDAGVPIKAPVAGIAMGLVVGEAGEYVILTDIQGIEDALGDMDFKVAGTSQGITALQMDIKAKGLTYEIMDEALFQAREARMYILDKMAETINAARPELSRYAPRMYKMTINPDKIRNVIGPGGKMIRSIIEETKVSIDISDDGTVIIGSPSEEAAQKAIKIIEGLTKEVEVGGVYTGKVTRIMPFGAFVEVLPGKEGLVHISELANYRVANVEDEVKVGDEVTVVVTEIDRMGRINLSRRALLPKAEGQEAAGVGGGGRHPFARRPESRGPRRPGESGGERRGPITGGRP